MKRLAFLLLSTLVFAQDDFMTSAEYGEMLYNNPRGISCAKCHGKQGEGKYIGQYFSLKQEKKSKRMVLNEIQGDRINNKTFDELKRSVSINHKVMPTYSLTDKEIKAIFDYLQKTKQID